MPARGEPEECPVEREFVPFSRPAGEQSIACSERRRLMPNVSYIRLAELLPPLILSRQPSGKPKHVRSGPQEPAMLAWQPAAATVY